MSLKKQQQFIRFIKLFGCQTFGIWHLLSCPCKLDFIFPQITSSSLKVRTAQKITVWDKACLFANTTWCDILLSNAITFTQFKCQNFFGAIAYGDSNASNPDEKKWAVPSLSQGYCVRGHCRVEWWGATWPANKACQCFRSIRCLSTQP